MIIFEQTGGPWLLSGVYASTKYWKQRMLWSEISKLIVQDLSSFVVGDFNYIVGSQEKMGGKQVVDSIDSKEFRDIIGTSGLIDLGYAGTRFTWCNN